MFYCIDTKNNDKEPVVIMWTPMQVSHNSYPIHFVPLRKAVSVIICKLRMYTIYILMLLSKLKVICILTVYIYRGIKLPAVQKALSKAGRGTGRGRGASVHGRAAGGNRRTRSMYDNSTPLESTPEIVEDNIVPENVKSDEKEEEEPKPIRKMQKARRGKPYGGGASNIRKLPKVTVSIEKSKSLEERVADNTNEMEEESKKEENGGKTEGGQKMKDEGQKGNQ